MFLKSMYVFRGELKIVIVVYCVLQVDDNMVNRRVATSMLSRYGATVSSVNSGVEAVAAVKNQKEGEILDLILMDIQMPEVTTSLILAGGL